MISWIKNTWNALFGPIPTSKDIDNIVKKAAGPLEEDIRFLQSVQKLDVKDGDIIVLKHPGVLKSETAVYLRESLQEALHKWGYNGLKVVLLEEGMDMGVLRKISGGDKE